MSAAFRNKVYCILWFRIQMILEKYSYSGNDNANFLSVPTCHGVGISGTGLTVYVVQSAYLTGKESKVYCSQTTFSRARLWKAVSCAPNTDPPTPDLRCASLRIQLHPFLLEGSLVTHGPKGWPFSKSCQRWPPNLCMESSWAYIIVNNMHL